MRIVLLLLICQYGYSEMGSALSRPLHYEDATDGQRELLKEFDLGDQPFPWSLEKKEGHYHLSFPSPIQTESEKNNTVHGKYWVPKKQQESYPAVVVLHWLGGPSLFLDLLCSFLAEQGICALTIDLPYYGPRGEKKRETKQKILSIDFEASFGNFKQAILDTKRAGDWLASRPEVSSVNILGVSLGAIIASSTAGIDTGFTKKIFIIGGGDLAEILLHNPKIAATGATVEQLREIYQKVEPLTYASRIGADKTLMINASHDQIIPKQSTLSLAKEIGVDRIEWFKGGHGDIAYSAGKYTKMIAEFLRDRKEI